MGMKGWTREQFLDYARANMKKREFRQRMRQANYTRWDENDLANLLCLEATGHQLDISSPISEKEEHAKSPDLDLLELEPLTPLPPLPKEEVIPAGDIPGVIGALDDQAVELLYKEYVSRYDMPEPNDRFMVLQLCRFQVALDKANRNYLRLLDNEGISQNQLKAAADQLERITMRVISMQKELGIDKVSRGAEADSGEKLQEYARQAKHALHRQGFPIICVNCARGVDKIKSQYGFVVWHFLFDSDWTFKFACPRCKQEMVYTKENVLDLKRLMSWDK